MARTVSRSARGTLAFFATGALVVSLCALGGVHAASGVTRPTASVARASDSHCDKPGRTVVNKKPFFGTPGDDVIDGTGGDDIIFARDGNDIVCGEGGNDIIYGGGAGDHLYGDGGNDQLFGQLLDDHLYGGPDDDLLVGGHGVDIMKGGGGKDWLRGGTNRDVYDGGGGSDDVASFLTATPNGNDNTGVTVDLGNGYAVGEGGPAPDPNQPHQKLERAVHIESVIGSAFDDTLIGNGTGMVDGGPGADTCSGSWIGTPTSCGPAEGAAPFVTVENWTPSGGPSPDPALLVVGGPADDQFTINHVAGGFHVDAPAGTAGCTDCAFGPAPARGRGGLALMWGGAGNDELNVETNASHAVPQSISVDVDGGPGTDMLRGSAGGENLFSGVDGADVMKGEDGEDALISEGTGGDQDYGGGGNDQLVTNDPSQGHLFDGGGGGRDIAGFARTTKHCDTTTPDGVVHHLGIDASLLGHSARFRGKCLGTGATTIKNAEILEGTKNNDILRGDNHDNTIWGRAGDDKIYGLKGGDRLHGHAGNDLLVGGPGADVMLGGKGRDHIDARDGRADTKINCGPGGGRLESDNNDPFAGSRCTRVSPD